MDTETPFVPALPGVKLLTSKMATLEDLNLIGMQLSRSMWVIVPWGRGQFTAEEMCVLLPPTAPLGLRPTIFQCEPRRP